MLTNENYEDELKDKGFTLILVGGNGCANCTTMYPIVNELKCKIPELNLYHLDMNETNNEVGKHYGVEVVPTILFLYGGELISKVKGYQPEEILEIYIDTKMREYKEEKQLHN